MLDSKTQLNETLLNQSSHDCSTKYRQVSTAQVLEAFYAQGYSVSSMNYKRAKNADKQQFAKHVVRLRRGNVSTLADVMPEIVIVNSYDGSSSLQLFAGLFRMVCANGLVLGKTFGPALRLPHVGNFLQKLPLAINATQSIAESGLKDVARLSSRTLTEIEQRHFATLVADLVLPDSADLVDLNSVLRVRRHEDGGADAWTILNRAQESAVRGGIRYTYTRASDNAAMWTTSRAIKAIDRSIEVNRAITDALNELVG